MAQETNDGIAYLMALKQSGAWVAPEEAKPAANTRPDATPGSNNIGERFQGAEKTARSALQVRRQRSDPRKRQGSRHQ